MPIDLEEEKNRQDQLEGMEPLTSESDLGTHSNSQSRDTQGMSMPQMLSLSSLLGGGRGAMGLGGPTGVMMGADDDEEMTRASYDDGLKEELKELHPFAQILGLADVESCVLLENATFPEHQRCSREKFQYRLTKCSELCLGLFTSAGPDSRQQEAATAPTANPPDSNDDKRKAILLAQLVATKTTNELVKDEDMHIPSEWRNGVSESEAHLGHKEQGRTLAIHSLAVLPDYQGRGLGTVLMKSYVQRMVESDLADRISLLTYDKLVPFYENLGFESRGKSTAQFGGGDWTDMVLEFKNIQSSEDEEEEVEVEVDEEEETM